MVRAKAIKEFLKYFIKWYSQNLAVPFWIVGHIHLSLNIYADITEYGTSILMNLIVAIGFWMEWREHKNSL